VPEKSVACITKMVPGTQVVGEVVKGAVAFPGELEIT
jgi:hypothetical protein